MNSTEGKHLLLDVSECPSFILDSVEHLDSILTEGIERCGATILNKASHKFDPSGVSMLFMLAESHLSIHTWPEKGYAAVDMYTCGNCDPSVICNVFKESIKEKFNSTVQIYTSHVVRGLFRSSQNDEIPTTYYHEIRSRF